MTSLEHVVATSTRARPGTRVQYLRAIRAFLDYAARDPARWTGAAVEAFRDHLVASRLGASTVNAKLSAIKFASKRLEALGLGRDFARAAEFLPLMREKKRFPPTFDSGKRLVDGCDGMQPTDLRDRALIVIALRTGCRREGLVRLQHADVEPGAMAITVVIKGGRRHRIALDPEAREALTAWLAWLASRQITNGAVFRSLRRGINGWAIGAGLHPSSVNLIFNKRAQHGDAGPWHPHLARHAFCSWAEARGVSRPRIANVTGHRSLDGLAPYLSDPHAEDDPVAAHLPTLFEGRTT